jgi:hypothetical protein
MNLRDTLEANGLPGAGLHHLPDSAKRFPDGAQYRIEIPSTEGPRCLEAALEQGERLGVPFHRISQGSGVFMLTDAELDEMARMGADVGVEISLFARPNASWGTSAGARAPAGGGLASAACGDEQLIAVLEDAKRAAEHGFRSVLLADIGVLSGFAALRRAGLLPEDMQAKMSVMLAIANSATARVLEQMGASTLNVPSDLPLEQIAAIRAAVDCPLDIYVEAPDSLGGFIRMHEIPELIRVGAPIYLKFGLRNAPDIYPSGSHLEATAIALTRERVRRARLGIELLERSGSRFTGSSRGAAGLAIPTVPLTTIG